MLFQDKMKNKIPLLAVLLLFTCIFFLFGHYKAYLYEDEVLSYTAANCQDGMRPALPVNRIVNGAEFVNNAVAVQPQSRFDFANAIANTSKDPHPPVYLLMLHFVCSLFPGIFSKWFALSINLIFGAVTALLLYVLGEKLFNEEKKGFIAAVIYILSVGFITQLMNLRMYVVLQALTTWLTLQYVCILKESEENTDSESFNIKRILPFIINVVLGTLTHYYFLIFAFFEAVIFSIMLIRKKRFRDLLKHTLIYVLSGGAVLILFPPIIWQLTGSDVGSESFNTRNVSELIRRFRVMFSHLNNELFGGQLKFYVLCLIVWLIYMIINGKRTEIKTYVNGVTGGFVFITLTSAAYFFTVSVTTPYLTGRYMTPIYPLCILITMGIFKGLIETVFKSQRVGYLILVVIMAVPVYLWISSGLYDVDKAAMQEISKEHSGEICVFFRGISTEENYFELENYDRVMAMRITPRSDEEDIDTPGLLEEKSVVVYVPLNTEPEECFERIREYNPKLTNYEKLYKAYYSDAYRCY